MLASATLVAFALAQPTSPPKPFEFNAGDRIVWIGNTLAEREQRYGYWEAALLAANREKKLTFRNLGWSGDTVLGESRAGFDPPAKGFERLVSLTLELKPTVIFISYGLNEAYEGVPGPGMTKLEKGLEKLLDALKPSNARIVLFTPIQSNSRLLNRPLSRIADSIKKIAEQRGHYFADISQMTAEAERYSDNGIHLSEKGYRLTAPLFLKSLGGESPSGDPEKLEALRRTVVQKNQLFFYRWRPQNETYLFGFRKHEQGKNAKEVAEFDPLVAKAEEEIERCLKAVDK